MHEWYKATDRNGTFVRVLLLDYSKAFDLINHHILVRKLLDIGLPEHLVRWIAAFLLDREQRVKIGSVTSDVGHPHVGTPQDTLSGPQDFLVQINDLVTPCPVYKYVDDSTIYEICPKNKPSVIQESADIAVQWSRDNDMKINATKTKEMLICFCRDKTHADLIPNIVIDNLQIERVQHAKVLGVTISSDLTWNQHVDNIVSKAARRVYMLYQLKRAGVKTHDLLNIYLSVIRPVVEYACPVWHTSLPQYLSDKIESIQRRVVRIIFPGEQVSEILAANTIPTLHNRHTELCQAYFTKMRDPSHKLHNLVPKPKACPYSLRTQHELRNKAI